MGKLEDLERLKKLKEDGILSEQEFENEKQKILNQDDNSNLDKPKTENESTTNIEKENAEVKKDNLEKNKSNKKAIKIFIITFTIFMVIFVAFCITFPIINSHIEKSKEVTVPNIIGKTLSEAKEELANLELNIQAEYPSLYSDAPEAIIQTQYNKEGDILKKGDTVKVTAKTQEQLDKEKQQQEENKRKQEEAKAKGYRSSPATKDTIENCAKTLIHNSLRSPSTAIWGKCEKVDEDNYGRCLVYVSVEAQNGFGAYTKSDYLVVLQYVQSNGEFTYKPYGYSYELKTFGGQPAYDYYVTAYKNGEVYPIINTFLDNNEWNTRPKDV